MWWALVWDGDDLIWAEGFLTKDAAGSYRISMGGRRQGYRVTICRG